MKFITIKSMSYCFFFIASMLSIHSFSIAYDGGEPDPQLVKHYTDRMKDKTSFDLSNENLGDKVAIVIAEALKINGTIAKLYLASNQIDAEGAKALAEALKINKTLTQLYLSYNQIDNEGAQAIAKALKDNKTLTTLFLGVNKIGNEGAQALAEALKDNKTLN